jgi:hypothetical protein
MREQSGTILWCGGGRETGTAPLAGVGCQGELGHQQQATTGFQQAQVHLSGRVIEDPVSEHTIQQTVAANRVITPLDPDQDKQPGADPGDAAILHVHLGPGYTLKQTNH